MKTVSSSSKSNADNLHSLLLSSPIATWSPLESIKHYICDDLLHNLKLFIITVTLLRMTLKSFSAGLSLRLRLIVSDS